MSGRTENTSGQRALRRERLSQLLIRRDQLGRMWSEHISHGLPDVGRLTLELTVAEVALTETWPHLADEWVGVWAMADARRLHDPEAGARGDCSLCAKHSRRAAA